MNRRNVFGCCKLAAVFLLGSTIGSTVGLTRADDVLIRIVGNGGAAKYIGPGDSDQRPVHVKVDDSVTWKNEGNRIHTASGETGSGESLFDTDDIAAGNSSSPQVITSEIYQLAGGQPGGSVEISYFCVHHSPMQSSLIVSDAMPDRNGNSTTVRRDITTLTADELNAYRDAWRQAQTTRQYLVVSGHHACPDLWCHRDSMATFLPWHREYVLRMEAVIGQPIHYWDWTSTSAATSGIPRAFTDRTYRSADGRTYSNPLYSFRFNCNGLTQTITRSPGLSSSLRSFARAVQNSYRQTNHSSFSNGLDGPHGSLHTWVRGQMFSTTYAAYDPIFWAHHSNVDRLWASWQKGGGPNPTSTELGRSLRGFGLAVGDRLDITGLGYAYDRYDAMPPAPTFMQAPAESVAMQNPDDAKDQGVGKTFDVSSRSIQEARAEEATTEPLILMAKGIPDHPAESMAILVFLNQPDAVPADATDDNPHFAGEFGIFGGASAEAGDTAQHAESRARQVLELVTSDSTRLDEPIQTVTLIATNEAGAVISTEKIPVTGVTLERLEAPSMSETSQRRVLEFTGVSENESFDEAYRDAADQAQARLGSGDRLIGIQVISTEGERGGIAGKRTLRVKIRAWVK